MRVLMFPSTVPTPYIPFTIRQRGAAAGVMVTASHNPKVEIHHCHCIVNQLNTLYYVN